MSYTDKELPAIDTSIETSGTPAATNGNERKPLLDLFSMPEVVLPNGQTEQSQVTHPPAEAGAHKAEIVDNPPAGVAKTRKQKATARITMPAGTRLAATANLKGRGRGANPLVAMAPGNKSKRLIADPGIYDHEDVGGKFTVFVLLYGPEQYHDLHRRCVMSILGTAPHDRMDIRIGSNELNDKSVKMVDELVEKGVITKHYRNPTNRYKYPLMREMFRDPEHPINTKWVVWFDDDAIADRTPDWLAVLCQAIIQHHKPDNAHMFGSKFVWTLTAGQKEWFESRPWYHDKPWRLHNGKPSPSGNKIIFATGGWWAITQEAIMKADIPCAGLEHNGGDYTIGEQLYQNDLGIKAFNGRKQFIHTSSVNRRGVTTQMPGQGVPKVVRVS